MRGFPFFFCSLLPKTNLFQWELTSIESRVFSMSWKNDQSWFVSHSTLKEKFLLYPREVADH